jgi:hypothetical protein
MSLATTILQYKTSDIIESEIARQENEIAQAGIQSDFGWNTFDDYRATCSSLSSFLPPTTI